MAFAILGSAAPASAGPSPAEIAEAKAHYKKGVAAYERELWAAAVEEFKAAYELSKSPDILFNIARAVTHQGREEEAIGYLKKYLAAAPNASDAVSVRTEIEARERALRDRQEAARAEAAAVEARREAEAAAAEARRAEAQVARAREEAARAKHPTWPGYLLLGGGFAILAAGVGLGIAAEFEARKAETGGMGGTQKFDISIQTRGQGETISGATFDVIGGATMAAGAGLLVWALRSRPTREKKTVFVAPGLGSVTLGGRF